MAVLWNATNNLCILKIYLVNLLIKCVFFFLFFFLTAKCCNNLLGPVSISEASACAADWAAHCHGLDWLNPARTQTTAMGCRNYLIWVEIYLGLKHPDISRSKVPAVFRVGAMGQLFPCNICCVTRLNPDEKVPLPVTVKNNFCYVI